LPEKISVAQTAALLPSAQADVAPLRDIPHYAIDLSIGDDLRSYSGQARVVITNTESLALDSLYFRLLPNGGLSYGDGRLTVTQTLVDGQPAHTALALDDSVLQIYLGQSLEPGKWMEVAFDFQGRVPVDFSSDRSLYAYGIYNSTKGVLALSSWYPILAVYNDQSWHLDPVSAIGDSVFSETAFYKVTVLAPESLVLVTTGIETSAEPDGDLVRHTLVSGPARDFFLIASAGFQVQTQTVEGTRLHAYTLPGDTAAGAIGLEVAAASLRTFNQHFGQYPYSELDVVEAPMRYAQGVEFPEIVIIGETVFANPDDPAFAVTIAHEVAHQWWYGLVGNDVYAEPWLDEALATYSSGVYYQEEQGEGAYEGLAAFWQERFDQLVAEGEDDQVTESLAHFESLGNPRIYSGVVYIKGALFFKTLRETMGDRAFFTALKRYFAENKYRVATTGALLGAFDQTSVNELDKLYQQWLYTP
jgi:aminopeptidase N